MIEPSRNSQASAAAWEEARLENLLRFAQATPMQKLDWLTGMRELLRERQAAIKWNEMAGRGRVETD